MDCFYKIQYINHTYSTVAYHPLLVQPYRSLGHPFQLNITTTLQNFKIVQMFPSLFSARLACISVTEITILL